MSLFYDCGDGTEEAVTLIQLNSEASGSFATILLPCGRERQTTIGRLRPAGANAPAAFWAEWAAAVETHHRSVRESELRSTAHCPPREGEPAQCKAD